MSEYTKLFERAGARYEAPELRMEELLKRQDRKRRNQRIRAGVLGLAIAIGVGWLGVNAIRSTSSVPADTGETTGTWTGPCADSQDGPPPQVCLGPLDEGTYTSQRFEPALTFTVPAGWNNPWDTRGAFDLWTPGWSDGSNDQADSGCRSAPRPCGYLFDQPGLKLVRDPQPDDGCSGYVDATGGTSAIEVATWVANHPAIATEAPSPVEVAGLTGYLLDVSLADTWQQSCPGSHVVSLFEEVNLNGHPGYDTMRLILLDLPDGGSLLIEIDGTQVDSAMPVVHSFEFDLT